MNLLIGLADQMRLRSEWTIFADFCELRGRGRRFDAIRQLERFLDSAKSWAFDARLEFTKYVLEKSDSVSDRSSLMPQPLCTQLVFPTLCEWSEMSNENALPHLWLGLL